MSSTAHLLVAERLLGFEDPGGAFTVMIQLGSIFAIMWLYRDKILKVLGGLPHDPAGRHFVLMVAVASLPLFVGGALLSGFVKRTLYGNFAVIGIAFVAGGIVMWVAERLRPAPTIVDADRLPLGRALVMGGAQALALVPGVSRSGGTIVAGMLAGVDRPAAAEFSFFLAMPALAAAFGKDLFDIRHQLGPERAMEITVGLAMAFVSSALVIRPFLAVVRRSGFAFFAWYRILAGVALLAAVAAGWT